MMTISTWAWREVICCTRLAAPNGPGMQYVRPERSGHRIDNADTRYQRLVGSIASSPRTRPLYRPDLLHSHRRLLPEESARTAISGDGYEPASATIDCVLAFPAKRHHNIVLEYALRTLPSVSAASTTAPARVFGVHAHFRSGQVSEYNCLAQERSLPALPASAAVLEAVIDLAQQARPNDTRAYHPQLYRVADLRPRVSSNI